MENSPLSGGDKVAALSLVFDELIASFSHDIKTTPSVIQGFTELLLAGKYGPLAPEQAKIVEKVHRNILTLTAMVDRILEFSRLLSDTHGSPVPIALANEWERACSEASAGTAGQPFCSCARLGDGRALVAREILAPTLGILARNALRLAEPGTKVESSVRQPADGTRLEIAIAEAVADRPVLARLLDDLFVQGSPRIDAPGGELGLAAARYLAALMGGKLESEAIGRDGLRLVLTLPGTC